MEKAISRLRFYHTRHVRAVTARDFASLSNIVNRELPESYIRFYTHTNGGHVEPATVSYRIENEIQQFRIHYFYHLLWDEPEDNARNNVFTQTANNLLPKPYYIPLAYDTEANQLFLDFSFREPKLHRYAAQECHSGSGSGVCVANKLSEFLLLLKNPD